MKRDVERQMALLGPPSGMRTTDENGKDTTKASKERLGRIRRLTGLDSPLAEGRSSVMTAIGRPRVRLCLPSRKSLTLRISERNGCSS
jgi:hypothetical protein